MRILRIVCYCAPFAESTKEPGGRRPKKNNKLRNPLKKNAMGVCDSVIEWTKGYKSDHQCIVDSFVVVDFNVYGGCIQQQGGETISVVVYCRTFHQSFNVKIIFVPTYQKLSKFLSKSRLNLTNKWVASIVISTCNVREGIYILFSVEEAREIWAAISILQCFSISCIGAVNNRNDNSKGEM